MKYLNIFNFFKSKPEMKSAEVKLVEAPDIQPKPVTSIKPVAVRLAAPMQVFEMIPGCDDFEADSNGQPDGFRNVGFWSCGGWKRTFHQTPKVGDLIAIRRAENRVAVYQLKSVKLSFTGSDGNEFWRGVMQDVIHFRMFTDEMRETLQARGI